MIHVITFLRFCLYVDLHLFFDNDTVTPKMQVTVLKNNKTHTFTEVGFSFSFRRKN